MCVVVQIRCLVANHCRQATAGATVCGIIWQSPWERPLGSFSEQSAVRSHCSESSMLVLWLIPFICMALDSVHRAFMCLVSFDLCSYPGRPADQIILFPFYAWEIQAWGVYDLSKVTKLVSARPSNRCARRRGAIQNFPLGWYAA